MKNLLWVTFAGLGDRNNVSAPTLWNTVEGFLKAGWKVWILDAGTRVDTPREEVTYEDGLYIRRYPAPLIRAAKWKKIGRIFSRIQHRLVVAKLYRLAKNLIKKENLSADDTVLYALEVHGVPVAKRLSDEFGMKMVERFYGTILSRSKDTAKNRLRKYAHIKALSTPADLVIMTNDGTKGDEVLKKLGNPSPRQVFWRNGVDVPVITDEPIAGVNPGDFVLMTLCRLAAWKHVDRAIAALPEVVKKHPETKLVVCGFGVEEENLKKQAADLGVAENVIFTGRVQHEKTGSYLNRADIFLSLYDLSNLGNPLFEAMRCGKTIVTIGVGATDTVITDGENGILLPPDRLEERIPETVIRLLDHPEEREKLSAGAKKYADENFYTWDERIQMEINEIDKLLA